MLHCMQQPERAMVYAPNYANIYHAPKLINKCWPNESGPYTTPMHSATTTHILAAILGPGRQIGDAKGMAPPEKKPVVMQRRTDGIVLLPQNKSCSSVKPQAGETSCGNGRYCIVCIYDTASWHRPILIVCVCHATRTKSNVVVVVSAGIQDCPRGGGVGGGDMRYIPGPRTSRPLSHHQVYTLQ